MKLKNVSLRYKLLVALTVIPIVGLSLFLALAVSIFEKDKIAYIFDSSLSVSKTRATRVSSEISSVVSISQAIVLSYRGDTKDLSETGQYYFEKEPKLHAFEVHAFDPEGGVYQSTVTLRKGDAAITEDFQSRLVAEARGRNLVVRRDPSGARVWLAARFGDVSDPRHVIALALFDAAELSQVFGDKGAYMSFLMTKSDAEPLFASWEPTVWQPSVIWGELAKSKIPEGIAELKSPKGEAYLASFVDTGVADLVVVSMVNRKAALQAIDILLKKSFLFFIAVMSATAILAVLASRGLTSSLVFLSSATRKVAEGDFEFRVEVSGKDEIGQLASSFNTMAEEVARLMKETAAKARMEAELATASAVQETLFPEPNAELGGIHISGHYMPASECGGDWWYYFENGDKTYIWVGDVTGHGAPAALLTSAARAVASVIQFGPESTPSASLGILNRAICETSKGKMMMTFFLACIDRKTGIMTYANASHEPPLLLHHTMEEPSRDDFIPLNAVNNPRLGEQPGAEFKEASVQLKEGDQVVFYTDGVVDVKNPEAKQWGERRFIKALSAEMAGGTLTSQALTGVVQRIESFRGETPLDDDVTLVLCSYRGAA
ncbi:MAG TPA: SpoIIE family protein phosphatase [Bdellovibrionales bacterium]|nr:SpoIIE family protein phosphatase [Bdellovibrionales bacterium]